MGRSDQNLGMRNEVQDLEQRINRERDACAQVTDEIARSTAALQDSTRQNLETQDRLRLAETDFTQTRLKEEDLQNQLALKSADIEKKSEELAGGDNEIQALSASIARAQGEIDRVRQRTQEQMHETHKVQRERDAELAKSQDLQQAQLELDEQLRARESQINVTQQEADRLRHSYNIATSNRDALQSELQALSTHIDIVGRQNNEMNEEIDHIIKRDEMIRSELNDRAYRVSQMRQKEQDEFRSSSAFVDTVRASSPLRTTKRKTRK